MPNCDNLLDCLHYCCWTHTDTCMHAHTHMPQQKHSCGQSWNIKSHFFLTSDLDQYQTHQIVRVKGCVHMGGVVCVCVLLAVLPLTGQTDTASRNVKPPTCILMWARAVRCTLSPTVQQCVQERVCTCLCTCAHYTQLITLSLFTGTQENRPVLAQLYKMLVATIAQQISTQSSRMQSDSRSHIDWL